jgi:hypothetical protein
LINSSYGTTDNTNISARSVIEHVSDIERDDNDERMLWILTDAQPNQENVPGKKTTHVL